jgi:GT2 family glycosyltransferase
MKPELTVVVATRNRGASVTRTLQTILENGHPSFQVCVVDQSDDDRTATALQPYTGEGRIRYLQSSPPGLARAHNAAISEAATELIALTDDDCRVPSDWLEMVADAFDLDPRIGIVFGNVYPAEHDPSTGLIPGYIRDEPFLARSTRDKVHVDGTGACMALRRSTWERIGGFDEHLGAGTGFPAANDGDFTVRALRAGCFVYETPTVSVTHDGFRTWRGARALVCDYSYGTGAMLAKHLKCRTPRVPHLLGRLAWRWLRGRRHSAAKLGGNRFSCARLASFVRGFAAGLVTPVDRHSLRFKPETKRVKGGGR